ncbi:MAG: ribosomal protein S18-alanine N-acetyltransferase [Anaerolineales bacterium]
MRSLSPELTLTIRPMLLDDIPAVQAIDQLSFTMPWPASSFHYELLENSSSRLWVAEINHLEGNKEVVGVIVVWMVVDEAHIATLAVHPDYRQMGIATRLLLTALKHAAQIGMQSATLEVRAANIPAQQLYQRFGFVVVGTRKGYYQDNHEDALIMTLPKIEHTHLLQIEHNLK